MRENKPNKHSVDTYASLVERFMATSHRENSSYLVKRFMSVTESPSPAATGEHLSEEQFAGYVAGTSSEDEADHVEEHLGECAECAGAMDLAWNVAISWKDELVRESRKLAQPKARGASEELVVACALAQEGGTPSQVPSRSLPYVIRQLGVEPEAKELLADWLAVSVCLKDGAGVFLDTGSSALTFWNRGLKVLLERGDLEFLHLVTWNYLVLKDVTDWLIRHPEKSGALHFSMCGEEYDLPHQSFFGPAARKKLMGGQFQPDLAVIGTSGITFSKRGILFGYHSPEEEFNKQTLFQFPCKKRVILAQGTKIGNAGGQVFDILSIKNIDTTAPIMLISTAPEADTPAALDLQEAADSYLDEKLQKAIKNKGIDFTWLTVRRHKSGQIMTGKISADVPVELTEEANRR